MKPQRTHTRRSRTRGFTFIELIVALALTAVLLRGMYTIFFAASDLARVSDEKLSAVMDGSAVTDSLNADINRSPSMNASNNYLSISTDQKSIVFQATRKTGGSEYVYIEYSLSNAAGIYSGSDRSGTVLLRTVWKDSGRSQFTGDTEGEDGASAVVARNVTGFKAWYFDNNQSDINDPAGWIDHGTLPPNQRTRALKFQITIKSKGSLLPDQIFTPIFAVKYIDLAS